MMTDSDILDVLGWLASARIPVWIDGGWGVDALIGEQTRPHDDLDLVIGREMSVDAMMVLASHGFLLHHDARPVSFIVRDANDRRVDFHPVRFDADGAGWQPQPDGSEFRYLPEGLAGTGSIANQTIRCLTAELQVITHLGYEPETDDFHDMQLLRDRLGATLPSPYAG
jgi:lincosamide nucleotidyltransferase A/C/D/E